MRRRLQPYAPQPAPLRATAYTPTCHRCAPLLEQPLRLADAATGGLFLGPGPQEQLLQGRLAAASMGTDGSGPEAPSFEVQAAQELEEWDASVRARHASQLDASLAEDDEPGVGAAAAAAAAVKGRPKRGRPSRVVDDSEGEEEEEEAGWASGAGTTATEAGAHGGAEPSSVQPMSDSSVSITEAAEQKEQQQQEQQQGEVGVTKTSASGTPAEAKTEAEAEAESAMEAGVAAAMLATAELYDHLSCVHIGPMAHTQPTLGLPRVAASPPPPPPPTITTTTPSTPST